MLAKLQAIEGARKRVAEARLADARKAADEAQERSATARADLNEADAMWSERLCAANFNLDVQLSFARLLLERERQVASNDQRLDDAGRILDQHRRSWQQLEASVQSGKTVLRRGGRYLARRAAEACDSEIADRTTWKWFRR